MASATLDLEEELDRLYQLPAGQFVAERDALAKRLRQEDRAASDRIKALRRPEIHAWVTNQLWWRYREPFERLLEAGRALRGEGKVPDPLGEQRDALRELLGAARHVLDEAGHPVDPWWGRVRALLFGVATGVGTPGRLTGDVDEPDLDAMFGAPPGARPAPAPKPAPKPQAPKQQAPGPARKPKPPPPPKPDLRALRRRQVAEERVRKLEGRLAEEEAALAEVEAELEELRKQVERAEVKVGRAEARAEATRAALAEAEREVGH